MTDAVAAALEAAHTGQIRHDGPGRTDTVNMSVPAESFVVPADIVSALGEGNTAHGFKVLQHMFPPTTPGFADGGAVPIVSAGGEYVVGPEHVKKVGGGDMKRGHEALKHFVEKVREQTIKTLKKLPKPVMK